MIFILKNPNPSQNCFKVLWVWGFLCVFGGGGGGGLFVCFIVWGFFSLFIFVFLDCSGFSGRCSILTSLPFYSFLSQSAVWVYQGAYFILMTSE